MHHGKVVVLLILAALLFGLWLWLRVRQSRPPRVIHRMRVITVDADGRQIGRGRWERVKEPERLTQIGVANLAKHVERLLTSPCWSVDLTFRSPEGGHGVSLSKTDGNVFFKFLIRWRQAGDCEAKVRAIFDSLGWEPRTDYLSGDESLRLLSWWAEGDVARLTEVCAEVLRTAYGVADEDEDALNVTYTEERRRPRGANPFRPTRMDG